MTRQAIARPSWVAMAAAIVAWAPASPAYAQQTVHEGEVQGALLLAGGAVAVGEEERVLLYPPSGASSAAIDGPFARITRLLPGPDGGLVVWDDSLWAAFAFAEDGGERGVLRFPKPGPGGGAVDFLAWLPGETGLFEEVDIGNPFVLLAGGSPRFPVRYMAVNTDGSRRELWVGQGRETAMHRTANGMSSAPVLFGYGALGTGLAGGRGFVVAQTEGAEAVVIAADGAQMAALPMPPQGETVTEDEVEAERARLIANSGPSGTETHMRMESILSELLPEDRVRETIEVFAAARIEAIRNAPANSLPPRISNLIADRNDRVWMRRFLRPGQSVATWDVLPIDESEGWSVQLPARWTVFDAAGTRILAGVTDEAGAVVRVVMADLPLS